MRALTLMNPWAWAVVYGGRDLENRTQRTTHRGRIWIHAGPEFWDEDVRQLTRLLRRSGGPRELPDRDELVFGALIGSVELVDCVEGADLRGSPHYSPWAQPHRWHWLFRDPQPLAEPIPSAGRPGLWTPTAPAS